MDKVALAKEIGTLETQIGELDSKLRKAQDKKEKINRDKNSAYFALLIGLLGILFLLNFWPLWLTLLFIGFLVYFTNKSKLGDVNEEDELKQLYEQINMEYHLSLKGQELSETDFQYSISGDAIGTGFIQYSEFKNRTEPIVQLLNRTTYRLMRKTYRESGISPSMVPYKPALSMPLAGSYAVLFRLIAEKDTQLPLEATPERIIAEVAEGMQLINENKENELRKIIDDKSYYNHFITTAKQILPDGEKVKLVGITTSVRSIGITRKRNDLSLKEIITQSDSTQQNENTREFIELIGKLDYAKSRKNTSIAGFTSNDNQEYNINIEEGFEDFVRNNFLKTVKISGYLEGDTIYLENVDEIE